MTPESLAAAMVRPAEQLAALVHNGCDASEVADLTDHMTHLELVALAVVLAAMTDPRSTLVEKLAWTDVPPRRRPGPHKQLKPHGTHAAYARHKTNGTAPCYDCVIAERDYQNARKRLARAAAAA